MFAARFPAQRFHTPTGSLYRRLLPRLSVVHLETALAVWVRGNLLSASTYGRGETLVQVRVVEKTNEIQKVISYNVVR